jgi:Leucine-rich repeat (LRR) protein
MNTSGLAQQLAEMAVAEMESPATAEEQAASVQTMNNRPSSNATTQTTTNHTAGGRTTPIRPRPMHMPPHEIRSSPLASEPKFSYEEDRSSSFLHEEAFHNRRASGSHHGGSGSGEGPSFHSASLSHSHNSNRNATGRLGSSSHHNSSHSLNNNSSSHGRGHSHSPAAASSLEKQKRLKTKSKQQSMVRRMKWEAQSGSADADAYYGNGSRHTDNDEEYVFTDDPQHPQYHVDSSLEVSLDLENDNHNRRHTSIGSDDSFSPSTFQKMERQQQQYRVSPSADVSHRGMSKRRRVNLLIDQCETVRFPFKKKLILSNMDLVPHDLPLEDLNALGPTLVKLSLARNRLMAIPDTIVLRLTGLRTLDLSQCELCTLPPKWNLPQLRRLNLSHNRLTEFPDEVSLYESVMCVCLFPFFILYMLHFLLVPKSSPDLVLLLLLLLF